MAINENAFIKLNYTGKVKETGDVFDTTYEDVAEEAGINNPDKEYKPMVLAVGSSQLIPKLHEEIKKLDVGDKKSVEIPCEDAFGKRDPSLIKLIPMKEFKKQGMTPYPGMRIQAEGGEGRILTVNGGRVKVDFNHPLAGKDLIYDVEVTEIIEDNEEKIKSMIELHYSNPNVDIENTIIEIDDGVASIQLDEMAKFDQQSYMDITFARFRIAKDIWENIEEVTKVNFVDAFEKREETDEEEDEE